MIFQHTLEWVLSGRKWQTRRRIHPSETLVDHTTITHNNRVKLQVGRNYAVQPHRNAPAVARMEITALHRQQLNMITQVEARAEGYPDRDAFLAAWQRIHGTKSALNEDVWVVEFRILDTPGI